MKIEEYKKKSIYSDGNGVSAYLDNNISMFLNEQGFYEEKFDHSLNEVSDDIVFTSTHLQSKINENSFGDKLFSDVEGIDFDPRIGYFKSLYVGYIKEGIYRTNASSGGMGTWIFKELLDKNIIDGVIHVKETTDRAELFEYGISRTLEEVISGSKTKYYPVEMSNVLKLVKDTPGKYAIIGIPSFIMSIRLLSEIDPVIKDRIRFTVGLICGHQKSSKFSEAMAWQNGILPGNLKSIDFRKKLDGMSSDDYGIEMTGSIDGKDVTITRPASELIGQNWGMGIFKSISSDYCDDVMNETADITIGDAWLPEYTDQTEGNNVIIIRNNIIDSIVKEAINEGRVHADKVDKETIFRSQAAHYRHTHDELGYRLFLQDKKNVWRPNKRVSASSEFPFMRKKVQRLRLLTSQRSNLLYQQAVKENNFELFDNEIDKLTKRYRRAYKIITIQKIGLVGSIKKVFAKLKKKLLH